MKVQHGEHGTSLWLSAQDTDDWARGEAQWGGGRWPCSQLRGKRLFAAFDSRGNLVDLAVNGRSADVDGGEFNAITSAALRAKCGADHPAIR
jgi:hypothetical protein